MTFTTIAELLANEVSPGLLAGVIQKHGAYGTDAYMNVAFHKPDSPKLQGALEHIETIAKGIYIDTIAAKEEGALSELFEVGWPRAKLPKFKDLQRASEKALDAASLGRETKGLLLTIALLLKSIQFGALGQKLHPNFESEAKLIEHLAGQREFSGVSKRNLEYKFAQAKRVLKDAEG
jgi:hypothetical protein